MTPKPIIAIRKPELVDDLLELLNTFARNENVYEYGLPMYDDNSKSAMREIVTKWLDKLEQAQV